MNTSANNLSDINGKAMVFGDNINTDIIIPSQYLEDSNPLVYCKFVMSPIRPTTWEEIQKRGDTVFVGGIDFGSGSSREQAPDAIKYAGVKAVIAESFATIFFRNCINVGLPLIELPNATKIISEGDEIALNLELGVINNKTKGKSYSGKMLEMFLLDKLQKGGLIQELQAFVKEHNL